MTTLEAVGRDPGRGRAPRPLLAAAVMLVVAVGVLPVSGDPIAALPGFLPAYLATLLGCDLLTCVLLVGRLRGGASPRLGVVAAGFAWSAVMVVGLSLATPGVLSASPLIEDPDALWWLSLGRQVVPPVLIALALVPWPTSWRYGSGVYDGAAPAGQDETSGPSRLVERLLVAGVVVAAALVVLAVVRGSVFPSISTASARLGVGSMPDRAPMVVGVLIDLVAVVAGAVGVAVRRSRSGLESWAVVAGVAFLGDTWLTAVRAPADSARYLVGHGLGLAAGLVVLVFLLHDVFGLHRRATRDAVRLQLQNSELLDAGRLRDHLVAVVSHEMRTPLAGLQGYLELLSGGDDLDERTASRMLERSWLLTRRLTLLAEDLLAVAAVENGEFVVIPETVHLAHQLDECAACFPDLDLTHECPSDLMVHADTLRLQQVLTNLVRNAQKHGAEPITISAEASGDHVVIRVADSGAGVPRDFVHRLFDRYAQGSNQRPGGSGLGLAVVRDLVRAQEGSVRYDLTDPAFVVTLPRRPGARPHHPAAPGRRPAVPDVPLAEPTGAPLGDPGDRPAPTSALEALALLQAERVEDDPDVLGPALGQPSWNDLSLTAKK